MANLFEQLYVKPKEGLTLIVGSFVVKGKEDRRALYKDAIGIDMRPGPGVDHVMNLEDEIPPWEFSHVDCLSVMEHSRRPWLMARNIERCLKPGGTLYIEVPFNWWEHAYPDDYFRMTLSGMRSLFNEIQWKQTNYLSCGILAENSKGMQRVKVNGTKFYAQSMSCGFGVKE
jgi:SAM-dependent methyltransferase